MKLEWKKERKIAGSNKANQSRSAMTEYGFTVIVGSNDFLSGNPTPSANSTDLFKARINASLNESFHSLEESSIDLYKVNEFGENDNKISKN